MASSIVISPSEMIPFDRLVLSQRNVRRTNAGVSIADLAESIARNGLLQALNVRPILDKDGKPTKKYEVPAGGRRYRAIEFLIKNKRLPKTVPIPCIVKPTDSTTSAEDDSLVENSFREQLHPLDQFRAFRTLAEQGMTVTDIAARFLVSERTVQQRLLLADVSPKLHEAYAADEMPLSVLEAFSVTTSHERQETLWTSIQNTAQSTSPWTVRRALKDTTVNANDKCVLFVGLDAYKAAGGTVALDLFSDYDTMMIEDPELLNRLVTEKLEEAAKTIRTEGWSWVDTHVDYARSRYLTWRHVTMEDDLPPEQRAQLEALDEEIAMLTADVDHIEQLDAEGRKRYDEINEEIDRLENTPPVYTDEDKARAGVVIAIAHNGTLVIERGLIDPSRQFAPPDTTDTNQHDDTESPVSPGASQTSANKTNVTNVTNDDDDNTLRPLSEALVTELSAHRTLALRAALGANTTVALQALLHALTSKMMYGWHGTPSCLQITPTYTATKIPDTQLEACDYWLAVEKRHLDWQSRLPERHEDLWSFLATLSQADQLDLLAHVTSLTVNVIVEKYSTRDNDVKQADQLADTLNFDMVAAGWKPTAANYLNRVQKPRILEAVTEACGKETADLLVHLKKSDMAREAERLMANSGWLPSMLRSHKHDEPLNQDPVDNELPAFLQEPEDEDGQGGDDDTSFVNPIAAE